MFNFTRSFQLLLLSFAVACVSMHSKVYGSALPGDGTFNIPTTGSASLPCGSALTIYDDGGPSGAYSVSPSGWLVLENSGASVIHLEGTYSFECGWDNVTIWDGSVPGNGIVSYTCGGTMSFESQPGQTISISIYGDGSLSGAGIEWNLFYTGECGVVNLPTSTGLVLECGNSFDFYDDGGSTGNYSPDNVSFLSIINSGTGVMQLSGNYNLGTGDSLVIYHGFINTIDPIASYAGDGELLFSSEPGMSILIYLYSDANDEGEGLDMQISYSGDCQCSGVDVIPPYAAQIPQEIHVEADNNCGAVVEWIEPYFYDNCSSVSMSSSAYPGAFFTVPGATVVYTITDLAGNSIEYSFDVIVEDVTPPVVSFYEYVINQANDPGQCGGMVYWTEPNISDNCGGIDSIWSTHYPGDFFNVGYDTVSTYAMDLAGNISFSQLIVNIIDTEYPEIICPANMTVCEGIPINYALPEVQDNCGALLYQTAGLPTGSVFPAGSITNGFAAADDNGNIQTCLFNITANPQPVVTLTAPEDTLCVQDISMTLDGQPAGGIYAGPGLDGATIIAEDAGIGNLLYTYEFTNEFGCTNSTKIGIVVDDCIGIEELGSDFSAGIYPNPADGNFFVNLPDACNLLIYDAAGQLVRSKFLPKGTHRLDVSELATGTYVVRVVEQNSGASATKKLILN
jgi:hypothetical protein